MRSKFTFLSEIFESCVNKLICYLFETLPVATRFNLEPMIYLIDVNFWNGSKSRTMLLKKTISEFLTHLL